MSRRMEGEAEYHSKDFEWEDLKLEVEVNPSLNYHITPFHHHSSPQNLQESEDAWQSFHQRHSSGKFFKERRYLLKEFPELVSSDKSVVLEVGCGSGSTAISILRGNEKIILYACDCSTEALERAKEVINAADVGLVYQRFHPFHCDFSTSEFPKWLACHNHQVVPQLQNCSRPDIKDEGSHSVTQCLSAENSCCIGGVDFVTLIFTLSALTLERMPTAIQRCFSVLKPGGLLLFRDYGLYDMTMLRFNPDQRIGFREYMRSDGTRSYFFSLDMVRCLFTDAGFIQIELEYCCIKATNRRNGKCMHRVWVHGKFKRPL